MPSYATELYPEVIEPERRGAYRTGPTLPRDTLAQRPVVVERAITDAERSLFGLQREQGAASRAAAQAVPTNPNVGPGGSAEARAFREAAGRTGSAAAPATQAVGRGALRAGAGRALSALASPTSPAGLALTAATAVPAFAEAGRERGAGRAASDPTAGDPAAGDLRPGQLGAIRADALGQARAEALRAAYANPEIAAQNAGAFNSLVQQQANRTAAARTPLPPTGAGAGRGFVNPREADVVAAQNAAAAAQRPNDAQPAGAGRGFVNPPEVDAPLAGPDSLRTTSPAVARAPGERNAIDIERAASEIDRQNSAARLAADAYGPGGAGAGAAGSLSSGFSADLARKNAETRADSLRFDARLAGERRGRELLEQAERIEAAPRAEQLARAGLENQLQLGAIRERGDLAQRQIADATARRGQDLEATATAQRNANALAVEQQRGTNALQVSNAAADARVAAAEARANAPKFQAITLPDRLAPDGLTVLKGGQVLVGSDGKIVNPAATPQVNADQALSQAKAAVAKGASKDAVNQRLRELGLPALQ
jgi:hypothetical protein